MRRWRPLFATLPGVSAPPPFGSSQRTIVVHAEAGKLRAYNMSPDEVVRAPSACRLARPGLMAHPIPAGARRSTSGRAGLLTNALLGLLFVLLRSHTCYEACRDGPLMAIARMLEQVSRDNAAPTRSPIAERSSSPHLHDKIARIHADCLSDAIPG